MYRIFVFFYVFTAILTGGSMTYAHEFYNMEILSPAFKNGDLLPLKYTCDGNNYSPPLNFKNVPDQARSLLLVLEDPDAPTGNWIHWVLFNLPPNTLYLEENIKTLPSSTKNGLNSWKKNGYGGACPPDREHRYIFKLYALDIVLNLPEGVSLSDIEKAIKNHILEIATLSSSYKRPFH